MKAIPAHAQKNQDKTEDSRKAV